MPTHVTRNPNWPFCDRLQTADVWSGALVIYALCTGRFAWQCAQDINAEYLAYKRGRMSPHERHELLLFMAQVFMNKELARPMCLAHKWAVIWSMLVVQLGVTCLLL
jgi:hypothetical protein